MLCILSIVPRKSQYEYRHTEVMKEKKQSHKAKCRSLCTRYNLCAVPVKPYNSAWCSKKSIMATDVSSDHIILHHTSLWELLILNIWRHEYKWISTDHPEHPHSVLKADGMGPELMKSSIKALLKSQNPNIDSQAAVLMFFYKKYRLEGKKNCSRHPKFGQIVLRLNQAAHNQRHREKPALSSLLQAYYYSAAAMMHLQDLRVVGCGK